MMRNNQKALLYLIERTSPVNKMELVKLMFLASRVAKFYDFVPYNYGPFSFELYRDLSSLQAKGFIASDDEKISIKQTSLMSPKAPVRATIDTTLKKFEGMDQDHLLEHVYSNYPEYTIFSKYKCCQDYSRDEVGITTIGYEGISFDAFLMKLIQNKVQILVDVRRNPFSMKYGFSKKHLVNSLSKLDIRYIHVPQLGIESGKRKDLRMFEDYQALFKVYRKDLGSKKAHLMDLIDKGREHKIALMCFEGDVSYCHRGQIADWLRENGCEVTDI